MLAYQKTYIDKNKHFEFEFEFITNILFARKSLLLYTRKALVYLGLKVYIALVVFPQLDTILLSCRSPSSPHQLLLSAV